MFHHPSPLFPDPFLVSDLERAFEDIVSMIAEAQSLEAQLEINSFDPALADINGAAESLWSATASRLLHFSQSTFCPEYISDAAGHLVALVLSDGADPGQNRHHLSALACAAATAPPPEQTRTQIARAALLMAHVLKVQDPFSCATALLPLSPSNEGY